MKKCVDIGVIALLTFAYVVVFRERGPYNMSNRIVGLSISSRTVSGIAVSTAAAQSGASLPEFSVYSEEQLPERFIAKTVGVQPLADYIILTEWGLQNKLLSVDTRKNEERFRVSAGSAKDEDTAKIYTSTHTPAVPKHAGRKQKHGLHEEYAVKVSSESVPAVMSLNVSKDAVPDVLTYPSVESYVIGNSKSYIYPMLSTGSDVILTILSETPYKDSVIIRYSVENRSKSYFFIEMTQLSDSAGNLVIARKFGEDFASPGKTETIYLIAKPNTKKLDLKLTSSGGTKCLEIAFTLP